MVACHVLLVYLCCRVGWVGHFELLDRMCHRVGGWAQKLHYRVSSLLLVSSAMSPALLIAATSDVRYRRVALPALIYHKNPTCLFLFDLPFFFLTKPVFSLTRENPTSPCLLWGKTALMHACINYTFTHVHYPVPRYGRPSSRLGRPSIAH